ncbi:long tail fiber protein proximal connector [Escherichia phage EcS1]|uniref:Hinge connector of long tail fiber, proximal connector n=1 Tax=Escherichia phage EcS1 TaxID=2083276 RepID=A0A2Z5ZCV3_9CAUD|nr:long tail fiber protein proximal connector [Escherichia phage EcS1]BBC78316.1 Hinge connector of long tail fiber, proximal connector [Escherichia phage EcS1]
MSNIMAGFGNGFVETQIISENNAVRYKLSIAAGLKKSVPAIGYVLLQDKPLGPQESPPGLTVREFNVATNTIASSKLFEFKNGEAGGASQAFVDYITALSSKPNVIVILTSGDRLYSNAAIDTWFLNASATSWPGTWRCSKFPCSYVAFYSPLYKKIVQEHATYSDDILRQEDVRAQLEIVYDKFNDIGATGFSKRSIEDPTEYSSSTEFDFVRYPIGAPIIAPMADYSLRAGSKVKVSFELYASADLLATGQTVRISFRWFKDTAILTSQTNEVALGQADRWIKYERVLDVPATADGFTIIVSRYPRQPEPGLGAIKNLIMTEVSRQDEALTRPAEFGVNGIRMNKAIDGTVSELLILADTSDDPSGQVESVEFRELKKDV